MNLRPPSVAASIHTSAFNVVARYTKRRDVALHAIGPLFPLPTLPSPHCTLKVSEHDSLLIVVEYLVCKYW